MLTAAQKWINNLVREQWQDVNRMAKEEQMKFTNSLRDEKKMLFDLFLEENQKKRKFMFMMFVCLHKKFQDEKEKKFHIIITSYVSGKMTWEVAGRYWQIVNKHFKKDL